jgi:protein SCO1/2
LQPITHKARPASALLPGGAGRPRGAPSPAHFACLALLALCLFAGAATAQSIGSPGGTFELTDHRGQRFASTSLAGRPYAIFFGFTYCPDVCPTTLIEMSNNLRNLGPDGDRLTVVFVTVDPERDTSQVLGAYLSSFDPRIVGLTGSEAEIAAVTKAWKAFYDKLPEAGGRYEIVHSAHVYLMDHTNHQVGTLNFQEPEAEQLAKLRKLVAGAPPPTR